MKWDAPSLCLEQFRFDEDHNIERIFRIFTKNTEKWLQISVQYF